MVVIRDSQGSQYGRGKKSPTIMRFMFAEYRAKISQSWNDAVFRAVDQELLMCEMIYPST